MTAHKRAVAAVSAAVATVGLAVGLFLILRPGPPAARPPLAVRTRLLSPFTGEPVASLGPVIAVKVDNIKQARQQTGLSQADIVYVLPVEGGLTRFLAVFSSHFPPLIGPVRSGGRIYQARWSRPNADGGTTFTTASGQPMTFTAGPVWVVLTAS